MPKRKVPDDELIHMTKETRFNSPTVLTRCGLEVSRKQPGRLTLWETDVDGPFGCPACRLPVETFEYVWEDE